MQNNNWFQLTCQTHHTYFGPKDENAMKLKSCYENCLKEVLTNNIKAIEFCCIATDIFNFPRKRAAKTAFLAICKW